ncbi:MAG: NAD-dependent epimerase/dehydratase family protein [Saprospiraceae bacterium]|nr:NAD-dependent epimerase/dehydratase family protein [Saprospiraceae bacterium]|tara:strand:- start:1510 stop:2511 length:1002 start_codon:yes stop_codon:yes gene_type:complete
MKVFVTGGTGFIGSYVLQAIREAGYRDIIAGKRKSSRTELVKDIEGITWIECDLFDVMQMEEIISGCDTIIHIAGSVSFSPWRKDQIFKTNVDATANLVNIALDLNVKRFIHFSSVSAFGISSKKIDESKAWTENKSKLYYSFSKYQGEKEAWRGFAEGLNLSIINPSFTIGGGFWNDGPMSMISKIDKGLNFYPSGTNGCVDVRDIAELCLILMKREDMSGQKFICSGHNISHFDLMKKMCDELEKPHPTKAIKGLFGNLAWRGASLAARIQGKETLLSKEAYIISSTNLSYDNSKSEKQLDMNYRSLEETIKETIACYVKSKKDRRDYGIL